MPGIAGNLLDYNTESMETDASGWTAVSGCTIARNTDYTVIDGEACLGITSTTSGDIEARTAAQVAVSPGDGYRASCLIAALLPNRSAIIQMDWYNASHTLMSSDHYSTTLPESIWEFIEVDQVAPTGSAYMTVTVRPQAGASGDLFLVDEVAVLPGILTLTATPNTAGAYVNLEATHLDIHTYDTLTITRTDPDGAQTTVRGTPANITSLSSWSGADYEAPLNVTLGYVASVQGHADGFSGGGTVAGDGTITAPDTEISVPAGTSWLKSLSQPALSRQVILSAGNDDVTRPARTQRYDVAGRRNAVSISDVRAGREGQLTLLTFTATDEDDLEALFDAGDILFLQTTPDMGFDDLYFTAGDLVRTRPSEYWPDTNRIWTVGFIESDAPSGELTSLPGNSWLSVMSFGSWQTVSTQRTSWLDVLNRAYGS